MGYKFKVGDMVAIINDCSGVISGQIFPLKRSSCGELWAGKGNVESFGRGCHCPDNWRLIPKTKFKAGDRVAVIECEEIKNYHMWEQALGKIYILNEANASELNDNREIILGGNEYCINFTAKMFEKF